MGGWVDLLLHPAVCVHSCAGRGPGVRGATLPGLLLGCLWVAGGLGVAAPRHNRLLAAASADASSTGRHRCRLQDEAISKMNPDKLRKLRPFFRPQGGTVTGAAVLCLCLVSNARLASCLRWQHWSGLTCHSTCQCGLGLCSHRVFVHTNPPICCPAPPLQPATPRPSPTARLL